MEILNQLVQLSRPVGRALLMWPTKHTLTEINRVLATTICKFNSTNMPNTQVNEVIFGENKAALSSLIERYSGKIDLIYIDPPFQSKRNHSKKVPILIGEKMQYINQVQYEDVWKEDEYYQFLYDRFILLKQLLSKTGSIYVHCDWHKSHAIKLLLDEVFGEEHFRNEIIWKRGSVKGAKVKGRQFARNHDTIFYYSKSANYTFNRQYLPFSKAYLKRFNKDDLDGRGPYRDDQAIGTRSNDAISEMKANGRIVKVNGKWRIKSYLNDLKGVVLDDNWQDIAEENVMSKTRTFYPTQKPEALLERIIATSSNEGDLILDCFCGSGTTAAVASKMGRSFICIDQSRGAITTTIQRLLNQKEAFTVSQLEEPFYSEEPLQHLLINSTKHTCTIKASALDQGLDYTSCDLQIDWHYDGQVFSPTEHYHNQLPAILTIPKNAGPQYAILVMDQYSNVQFVTIKGNERY